MTIVPRCEAVAAKCAAHLSSIIWCHFNEEADLLEKIIPGAKQVQGSDSDEEKEKAFLDFADGKLTRLITKPKIGAFGLNFQNCHHMTFFPSHSFEQYYQGVRRSWRFGQKNPVTVDIITTQGELGVLQNLQRKSKAASDMFDMLVREMTNAMKIERNSTNNSEIQIPTWL